MKGRAANLERSAAHPLGPRHCLRCREELAESGPAECCCCGLPFDPDNVATWSRDAGEPGAASLGRYLERLTPRSLLHTLSRRFPRNPRPDQVSTEVHFNTSPEAAWESILFYEEVAHEPPLLLRWTLPVPVRSEGRKSEVGDVVRCVYRRGFLIKRITEILPGRLTRFEVLKQDLAFESSVTLGEGSYQIYPDGPDRCRVVLTTVYSGHLQPRSVWKPLERRLVHLLHRHVLEGMRRRSARPSALNAPLARATNLRA